MKIATLRGKNKTELLGLLKKGQSTVESSVSDVLQGKSKNTSMTKMHRREVARILTVLGEKKLIKEVVTEETKEAKEVKVKKEVKKVVKEKETKNA